MLFLTTEDTESTDVWANDSLPCPVILSDAERFAGEAVRGVEGPRGCLIRICRARVFSYLQCVGSDPSRNSF